MTLVLGGCALTDPLTADERDKLAADTRQQMFEGQEALDRPLTLADATARAVKYQAEHRQKRMEEAAAEAQLDVARFDLLPRITTNAGYSWRNNESFGFGFTPDGTVSTNPTASVERRHYTANIGLAWSVLDFGASYFRARQLSDQKLILEERRRKAVQTLMHDVRVAWWRAEAAERLLPEADRLLGEIDQAVEKTRVIESSKLLPPVQTATLRRALLDLAQQIAFRRQDLAQAQVELAALISAPPGAELRLEGPDSEARVVLDLTADIGALETLALRTRPEIAEEGYRGRISRDEARKALVGLLPNLSLDTAYNYDSNKFLLNNTWTSAGIGVALNLVKAFSYPAVRRSEAAQRAADDARRMAMAMAVLAQTRLSAVRYALVADEYLIWDEAVRDDDLIVKHLSSSERVGIDNELELVRARARALASRMNRDLAYANLQASIARLYNSVGYDAVPRDDETKAVADLAKLIDARFGELERASFSRRVGAVRPSIVAGAVSGAPASAGKLVKQGLGKGLQTAGFSGGDAPEVTLNLRVRLEGSKEGARTARVVATAVPRGSDTPSLTREFRTALSEPVDDEQWRALGEGAVYRMVTELSSKRVTQASLRMSERLAWPARNAAAAPDAAGEPLPLRLDGAIEGAAGKTGGER